MESINELIDKVKEQIAKTNDQNAPIILEKLDSVRFDFGQLQKLIPHEKLLMIQKYYRQLLVFLVKNKVCFSSKIKNSQQKLTKIENFDNNRKL